jgi:flagellar basal body-associated protein FliL
MSETVVEPAPRSSRRRLVLIAGVVVLLLLLGGGWWAFASADASEPPPDVDGEIVLLEPLTTTVGENGIHHARVTLAVVLTVDADSDDIEARAPLLQDALLREVAATDATTIRSAAGSDELRAQLSAEARQIWGEEVVRRVVLTELLVQ